MLVRLVRTNLPGFGYGVQGLNTGPPAKMLRFLVGNLWTIATHYVETPYDCKAELPQMPMAKMQALQQILRQTR